MSNKTADAQLRLLEELAAAFQLPVRYLTPLTEEQISAFPEEMREGLRADMEVYKALLATLSNKGHPMSEDQKPQNPTTVEMESLFNMNTDPVYKQYKSNEIIECRPYIEGEDLADVIISGLDREIGSPKPGDVIARVVSNPKNQWLMSATCLKRFYTPIEPEK